MPELSAGSEGGQSMAVEAEECGSVLFSPGEGRALVSDGPLIFPSVHISAPRRAQASDKSASRTLARQRLRCTSSCPALPCPLLPSLPSNLPLRPSLRCSSLPDTSLRLDPAVRSVCGLSADYSPISPFAHSPFPRSSSVHGQNRYSAYRRRLISTRWERTTVTALLTAPLPRPTDSQTPFRPA